MRTVVRIAALCVLLSWTTAACAVEPTVNDLIAAVKSPDQPARLVAMDSLGRMGGKAAAAVPAIAAALKDPSAVVRVQAAQALGAIGAPAKPAVPELTALIDDPRPDVRRAAILALAEIGAAATQAIPRILKALDDPGTKTAAIDALDKFRRKGGNADARDRQKVDAPDQVLDAVSLWAIARLHPEDKNLVARTTERLCETLKAENPRARKAAARALASLKPGVEILLPAMIKAFQGASDETVHNALEALAAFGDATVPELIDTLKLDRARPYAVVLLGRQGAAAKPAVGPLVKLLDDKDAGVRREAVLALARIGPAAQAAVPALIRRFRECLEREGADSYDIAYALGCIKSPEAVPILLRGIAGRDESVAIFSAWALVQIEPQNAATAAQTLPLLIRGLHAPEARLRRTAAEALKELGPAAKPALPELRKAEKDTDPAVRQTVAAAIAAASR
jgi:HEAT repeat protein